MGQSHVLDEAGRTEINNTPILSGKAGSEVSYGELSKTSFEVRTVGYPRIVLTVSKNGLYFKANWKRIESSELANGRVPGEDEVLNLDLDEKENLFVRTKTGDVLVREAVAEYLLHKFLI